MDAHGLLALAIVMGFAAAAIGGSVRAAYLAYRDQLRGE